MTGTPAEGPDHPDPPVDGRPVADPPSEAPLADRLAAAVVAHGVDTLFGLPGGGPNLDLIGAAAARGVRFVLGHTETATAIMAATHGLLTGRPSPVVVTRGPGVASVANGVAQATLDRFPLTAVTDTVPAAAAGRVAHQRFDQRAFLAPVAKRSITVTDGWSEADLADAVAAATRWPYGAVHLDVDPSRADRPTPDHAPAVEASRAPVERSRTGSIAEAAAALGRAERPLVILGMEAAAHRHRAIGESGPASGAADRLPKALTALGCPVLMTYQALGAVPTDLPISAGVFTNGALERPVLERADLVLTVGLDLVEPIPAPWSLDVPVVRLSAQPQRDDYLPISVDVEGDPVAALVAIVDEVGDRRWGWEPGEAARHRAEARRRLADVGPDDAPAGDGTALGPLEVVDRVQAAGRPSTPRTVTVDAGAHFLAVMPNWDLDRPFGLLISNGLATMGFAVPAAIGAALARPDDHVVALTGDGGLSMVVSELETIARLDLPIVVVVFNDAALSLIEIKQRDHHGGPAAVRYRPVDYAAVARGHGLAASVATTGPELAAALDAAGAGPHLIDARIDPRPYRHLIAATRG